MQRNMSRITAFSSSSTKLAIVFTLLITAAIASVGYRAYQLGDAQNAEIFLQQLYLIIGMLMLLCVGLFTISYYVTKRINMIVTTADNIMRTGDLSARIPIDCAWDDLSKLSITLNHMLAEIETSVGAIRTVSDNIAHDLRHPLTRLRNHIDNLRNTSPKSESDYASAMQSLLHECDGLLTTFQALLRIGNVESGKRQGQFTQLSLTNLLKDVVELYEPLAAEKSIVFSSHLDAVTLKGDKDLLFQLFANLCDNAVKYTPPHGTVSLTLSQTQGAASITICDSGPGIPDSEHEKVFGRFYRLDSCRNTPGNGLGLSLVAAIVRLHQGSIRLSAHQPSGLQVEVKLPL
jgi:signal transduction histidine kinase